MSSATEVVSKCSKIRHIVRLRQMMMRWRRKARLSAAGRVPADVPAGHVAVCVGDGRRRFVVRAAHLNHPVFRGLLMQAEEEYGFTNSGGPLVIPCDETLFEDVLRLVSRSGSSQPARTVDVKDLQRYCHVGGKSNGLDLWVESRPLLHGPIGTTGW
ncbi:auxin-responsive protein SAUR50-like [Punica granatum]|uniref:Auxin-responsive protein SAUR50-like n=1 Tax=Punica granatum TaxID=22663 RepID=A0A6P8EAT8_PUNGR|nr:auxin-responsive protein SAUR50-like [Punica granatum]